MCLYAGTEYYCIEIRHWNCRDHDVLSSLDTPSPHRHVTAPTTLMPQHPNAGRCHPDQASFEGRLQPVGGRAVTFVVTATFLTIQTPEVIFCISALSSKSQAPLSRTPCWTPRAPAPCPRPVPLPAPEDSPPSAGWIWDFGRQ